METNLLNAKITKFANTIWRNKKKSAFFLALSIYGLKKINSNAKDDEIRRHYGEEARKFAKEFIEPTHKLRRVTVLVNKEAGNGKAAKIFNKNALPLLNLAGLDVNVINVNSAVEIEQIARAIDQNDTDCIFIAGDEGGFCHAITGICQRKESEYKIPIGLFPASPNNVRLNCQSAMALIENNQKMIYPMKCTVMQASASTSGSDNSDKSTTKTYWLIDELSTGWFDYYQKRASKFWWMGPFREWYVYSWETIKAHPNPLRMELIYEEHCPGCKKCLPNLDQGRGGILGWIGWIFGLSEKGKDPKLAELARRQNPNCGNAHSLAISGTDIRLRAEQQKYGNKLVLHNLVTVGRIGTFKECWRQFLDKKTAEGKTVRIPNLPKRDTRMETKIEAQRIQMNLTHFPEKIHELNISGKLVDLENKEIFVEATRHGKAIPFFVPADK